MVQSWRTPNSAGRPGTGAPLPPHPPTKSEFFHFFRFLTGPRYVANRLIEPRYTEWASSGPTACNPRIGVARHTQARCGLNPCGGLCKGGGDDVGRGAWKEEGGGGSYNWKMIQLSFD